MWYKQIKEVRDKLDKKEKPQYITVKISYFNSTMNRTDYITILNYLSNKLNNSLTTIEKIYKLKKIFKKLE